MQFLDQAIEFTALGDHATPTWVARVDDEELQRFCVAAHHAGRRLVALWGSDERDRDAHGGFALHVALDLAEGLACLTLPLASANPVFPDLASFFPAAIRQQRAAFDMVGIRADSGDLRPWLRHDNWPAAFPAILRSPMRSPTARPPRRSPAPRRHRARSGCAPCSSNAGASPTTWATSATLATTWRWLSA